MLPGCSHSQTHVCTTFVYHRVFAKHLTLSIQFEFAEIFGTFGGDGGIRTPDTVARMPHFECGAFNRSATSPEPKQSLKKPVLCGRYLTKRAKRDKRQTGLWRRILCARIKSRLLAGKTMRDALKF